MENIKNDFDSYQKPIDLYYNNQSVAIEIIELQLKGWFSAHICSFLGAILTVLEDKFNIIKLKYDSNDHKVLLKNNFLSFYGKDIHVDTYGTTIPYEILFPKDDRHFAEYIQDQIFGKGDFPNLSTALRKKLLESICEIFHNAKMHSQTEKIFICGQFFSSKKQIQFMITDIGWGIREVFNRCFNCSMSSIKAIKWSLKEGHTTKQNQTGGLGLSLLFDFIQKNQGEIQIVSNDGFYEFKNNQTSCKKFNHFFPGTMVNIMVKTDDPYRYQLSTEANENINDIF